MTAPGDLIQAVQGFPISPHGVDPDDMPGVIHLSAGDYDDGRPMAGPDAWWRRRAGFVNYHVWGTPFDEAEVIFWGTCPECLAATRGPAGD